jgi:ribosomal protein S18 acetylase RimI-like enzyme
MSISVRRATPDDVAELHDVAAQTFALACPPGTLQSDVDAFVALHLSPERFADYLADDDRILLLAEAHGKPVGYAMLVRGPITDADVCKVVDAETSVELSKFYVMVDRHGSGVAAALMTATLEAAAATGAQTCWLGVNQLNVRAGRFYEKSGFTIAGTKRFLVGQEWHDDYICTRSLP